MNILICVKQVPDTTEIKIDPVKNTLIRDGVPSILNPFDAYALEAAARIKDKNSGTKLVALSMGPQQATAVLKDCLSIAADKAYLVSSRFFGGSDTLATSYILSEAVKAIEEKEGKFDLIFCGKQAIDGDTAQVGPEMAEHLGYPQITYGLEAQVEDGEVKVRRETETGAEIMAAAMPCVVTFTKPSFEPRYPTLMRKMAAGRATIPVLTEADLPGIDLSAAGLKGSPTKVKKTFVPQRKTGGIKIEAADAETGALELFAALSDGKII